MREKLLYTGILLVSVLISAFSQILLKKSALRPHRTVVSEYLNALVISAYGIYFAAVCLDLVALRKIPASFVPVIESSGYIFITVLGRIFFKERISVRTAVSMALILAGIGIFVL